jgi:hypothetical protein
MLQQEFYKLAGRYYTETFVIQESVEVNDLPNCFELLSKRLGLPVARNYLLEQPNQLSIKHFILLCA